MKFHIHLLQFLLYNNFVLQNTIFKQNMVEFCFRLYMCLFSSYLYFFLQRPTISWAMHSGVWFILPLFLVFSLFIYYGMGLGKWDLGWLPTNVFPWNAFVAQQRLSTSFKGQHLYCSSRKIESFYGKTLPSRGYIDLTLQPNLSPYGDV